MRALAPPDVELIKRLEAEAQRDPSGYRRRIGWLSAAGNIALTAINSILFAVPIVIILLRYNSPVFDAVLGFLLLLLLWSMRPTHEVSGHELKRTQAPELYAALDQLREKLDVRQEMRIFLDGEFNAGALEMPGLLGSFGTKRIMYLGVPLLCALSREELLAVIGHELGHFSRRHGPLGQRIYRVRLGWLDYVATIGKHDTALDKGAAAFARMFVPYFNSYTFVYGRKCEYEADADAASAVGAAPVATALARTQIGGDMWFNDLGIELAGAQRDLAEPPEDLLDRFAALLARTPQEQLDRRVAQALAVPSDWLDTHPCLAERAAALAVEVRLTPPAGPCAGAALLKDAWPNAKRDFVRKWQDVLRASWALEHARQNHLAGLLEAPAGADVLGTWPLEQRLARADLLAAQQPAQAMAELHALLEDHPQHPGASYALGVLALKSAPAEAVALLEHAAKQDHGFRVPAYLHLEKLLKKQGDAKGAYNYARRLERAHEKRSIAAYLFRREIDLGQFIPLGLPAGSTALLHQARGADAFVVGGWALSRDPAAPPPPPTPSGDTISSGTWFGGHALILLVDPEGMRTTNLTEDQLAGRYGDCLRSIVSPNQLAVVRVLYSTEVFSPELKRALDALPESCRV